MSPREERPHYSRHNQSLERQPARPDESEEEDSYYDREDDIEPAHWREACCAAAFELREMQKILLEIAKREE